MKVNSQFLMQGHAKFWDIYDQAQEGTKVQHERRVDPAVAAKDPATKVASCPDTLYMCSRIPFWCTCIYHHLAHYARENQWGC